MGSHPSSGTNITRNNGAERPRERHWAVEQAERSRIFLNFPELSDGHQKQGQSLPCIQANKPGMDVFQPHF